MESETSLLQQPSGQQQQQEQQQQEQQQQQQQQQQRRPESVSASEAEKRASTSHGRPETRESSKHNTHRPLSKQTNENLRSRPTSRDPTSNGDGGKTPHTTPRDPNAPHGVGSVDDFLRSMVSEEAVPGGSDVLDDILDEDELFMALSPDDREEWNKMMASRERQLFEDKEKHQNWADSFTRRRMFAYSRMRKLNLSHQERIKFFADLSNTINQAASRRPRVSQKKTMSKRMSEPLLESENESLPAARSADKTLKHSQSSGGLMVEVEAKPGNNNGSNATSREAAANANTKLEDDGQSIGLNAASGRKNSKGVVCTVEQVS